MKADDLIEKEIMDVLHKFAESYSKRDMERLSLLLSPDPDVVLIGIGPDEKRIGLDAIKTQFESDWSEFEVANILFNLVSISAADNFAWVTADTLYKMEVEEHNLLFPCYLTVVLQKHEDKWLIVQMHYSAPLVEQPHYDVTQYLSQL
jgi:ketosteroid isomerase-like protein